MNHSTSTIPNPQRSAIELKLNQVLVVDDVELNREVFIMHLGNAVRNVDQAADGWEALALFKERAYDAVLLDIEMPELDGYETLKAMRAWEREQHLPATPVVAITSSDFPEDERRVMAAGATAYLKKPLKQQALMAALQLNRAAEPGAHPMASLLPRFFVAAHATLDELTGLQDLESISKILHQLRGMIALYGFTDFAEWLREINIATKRGEMLEPALLEQLRKALRDLETATQAQS
ncbi:MAG: response regulator [Sulfuricellaceae bacterium]